MVCIRDQLQVGCVLLLAIYWCGSSFACSGYVLYPSADHQTQPRSWLWYSGCSADLLRHKFNSGLRLTLGPSHIRGMRSMFNCNELLPAGITHPAPVGNLGKTRCSSEQHICILGQVQLIMQVACNESVHFGHKLSIALCQRRGVTPQG